MRLEVKHYESFVFRVDGQLQEINFACAYKFASPSK
jgi:hypothetical protein